MLENIEFKHFTSAVKPRSFFSLFFDFIFEDQKGNEKEIVPIDTIPFDKNEKAALVKILCPDAAVIAILKFGTCYVSSTPISEDKIIQELKRFSPMRGATADADFEVAKIESPFSGWIVRSRSEKLFNIFDDVDFSKIPLHLIGIFGRSDCQSDLIKPEILLYSCNIAD